MQNKRRLFIIGASHLARELESWIDKIPQNERNWEFEGFLHDLNDGDPLDKYPSDFKILGDWKTFEFKVGDRALIGVTNVEWRKKIYNALKDKVSFEPFIAHNAIIGKFNEISDGAIICPNCILTTNIKLGIGVLLNIGTQIGHDVTIGDFSSLMANINIAGHCMIGSKVFIGSSTVIIPKRTIADNITVGAGSVVVRNFKKEGISLFGNPAKEI